MNMRRWFLLLPALALAFALGACGSSSTQHGPPHGTTGGHPNARAALRDDTPQPALGRHSGLLAAASARALSASTQPVSGPRGALATAATTAPVPVEGTPKGPPAPTGGWRVAYADGFGLPLGTAGDNTWKADSHDKGCCNNSNETYADERTEMTSVTPEGLDLRCEHKETLSGVPYTCGGVAGYSKDASGYRTPKVTFTGGYTAIEFVAKLPHTTGADDPGIWMDGEPWSEVEWDLPEFWGYGSNCKVEWEGCTAGVVSFAPPHPALYLYPKNEWASSFHHFTTYIWPTGSGKYRFTWYVDGVRPKLYTSEGGWKETTQSPEVTPPSFTKDPLVMTFGMRNCSGCSLTPFQRHDFTIRSVAIYTDEGHTSSIVSGGVAPGTAVGGSEPTPTPPPETTPTPPPPSPVPATPTGIKVTASSGALNVSWTASSGASGYHVYRTGPWPSWVPPGSPWTSTTTATSVVNKAEVAAGREYCFRVSAYNSSGTSAKSGRTCIET